MPAPEIGILVVSGFIERLQMAATTAAVGAVSGNRVTVFLSMNSLRYFVRGDRTPAPAEGPFGLRLGAKETPPFRSLFEQAATLGDAKIHPCPMAMDVLGLQPDSFEPWLAAPMGLTAFLDAVAGAQVWSF